MSDGSKKISFSFSKVKKSALSNKPNLEIKEKVDLVDCFDGSKGTFSYKGNVKKEDQLKQELIIPLVSTKTSLDIIKSRIAGKALEKNTDNSVSIAKENSNGAKNLEELAALEILKDIKNNKNKEKDFSNLIIDAKDLTETKESSELDIDYDSVPVSDFGMAMLRGMGWKANTGIGKEPKLVPTVSPKLRPKGLGLGAKPVLETTKESKEENKMISKGKKSKSKGK